MMEIYPIDTKVEQRFQELGRRIFRLQNGRSIDSMERVGADTRGQIGASYLSLKNLARQYQPDMNVAMLLWGTGKREEQIVACFLFSPGELNAEKITQLLPLCHGTEIAEYFGTLVLSKRADLVERVNEYLHSGDAILQTAALTAIGRNRIDHGSSSTFTDNYIRSIDRSKFSHPHVSMVYDRIHLTIENERGQ